MTQTVIKISAIGARGKNAGVEFVAKKDASGNYALTKKLASGSTKKVKAKTLAKAVELLEAGKHSISLESDSGVKAQRTLSGVTFGYDEAVVEAVAKPQKAAAKTQAEPKQEQAELGFLSRLFSIFK